MRINAIINIREGDVVMNNVDFDGIEIGNNRAYTLQHSSAITYEVNGAIIAVPFNHYAWTDHLGNDQKVNSCGAIFDTDQALTPCGRLTWTTGRVTGLNRDVNAFDYDGQEVFNTGTFFWGFMDVMSLLEVNLSELTFEDNIMPMLNVTDQPSGQRPIMKISICSKVVLDDVKFKNNLSQYGGIYVIADRRFMISIDEADPSVWSEVPNDMAVAISQVTFERFWVDEGYALRVESGFYVDVGDTNDSNQVPITIDQCEFYHVHGSNGTNHGGMLIQGATTIDPTLPKQSQDYDGWTNWVNPLISTAPGIAVNQIVCTISAIVFGEDEGRGNYSTDHFKIKNIPKVVMSNAVFYTNKDFQKLEVSNFSMWYYLLTTNSFMRETTYISE